MAEIRKGPKEAKFALVTGGTRGIGYGIAQKLAESGYDLILGYNSNDARAETAKSDLTAKHNVRVFTVKGDVAKQETVNALFEAVRVHFGNRLNAFVHNAGLQLGITTDITSDVGKAASNNPGFHKFCSGVDAGGNLEFALYDYYQNVYPKCFARCVEKSLPLMQDGNGYIVAISSPGCNSNSIPFPDYVPGPAKAVLEYQVRNYAVKLAPRRITCNCVIPGLTESDASRGFFGQGDQKKLEAVAEKIIPMKKLTKPENIGDAVAFLCSPKASFITGAAINVDGGRRLTRQVR